MDHGWLVDEIRVVLSLNKAWMRWNLTLALIPALLALVLLWRPHRRTVAWWCGIGVFTLFLPNAPYVVTDLVHLRPSMADAPSRSVVVFGVLPLYAAFITAGFISYLICLELIVREVRSVRPSTPRWAIELPVHAICTLGIVLGRIARLNSWDTVSHPRWTTEQIFNTLTWQGAPAAFVLVFAAVFMTSMALRAVGLLLGRGARRGWAQLRPAHLQG